MDIADSTKSQSCKKLCHSPPSIDDLVDALLIEILIRLPAAKFAFQCKLVSKRWYSLISTPYFVSRFIRHQEASCPNKSRTAALVLWYVRYYKIVSSEQNFFGYAKNLDYKIVSSEQNFWASRFEIVRYLHAPLHNQRVWIVASCQDLLLCEASGIKRVYHIVNLITTHSVALPPFPLPPKGYDDFSVGITCKYEHQDQRFNFKVVRISVEQYYELPLITYIFSSETNQWQKHIVRPQTNIDFQYWNPTEFIDLTDICVSCNGMLYCHNIFWNETRTIFCYNLYSPERIRIVEEPKPYFDDHNSCIGVCQESLLLVQHKKFAKSDLKLDVAAKSFWVWELEDYNEGKWTLKHKVSINEMKPVPNDEPLFGKVIFLTDKISLLAVHPTDADTVYCQVHGYIVSCNLKVKSMGVVGHSSTNSFVFYEVFPLVMPWWPTSTLLG